MSNVHSNYNETQIDLIRPDGTVGIVTTKTSLERSASAEEEQAAFFATVDPASFTDNLQRDIAKLEERLNDFSGYDRDGTPQMRLTGRARQDAEFALGNRRNALKQATVMRAHAERVQAEARRERQATAERIEAAAQIEAKKLIEEKEVSRRAAQIAARAGA